MDLSGFFVFICHRLKKLPLMKYPSAYICEISGKLGITFSRRLKRLPLINLNDFCA
jgi:hypothetical protein